ncbi:lipopolysaccharide transport periplasmic protein LptA [Betaproteobacteria bacterium SCN2]|jgi:lipopolysaccharide export system protein LptA|nr:lipopolysaccharide transport periplasmic protein LptA [Betaproteobacteria bacterium SCN2]
MPTVLKLLLVPLLAVLSLPAMAEKADREKPVHLEADNVTLDDIRKVSVFEGNVLLVQGTLMLRADRVEAKQNGEGLQSVTARGKPVSFRQKRDGVDEYIEGFSSQMEYDNVQSILRLIGDARLRKGGDEIRGNQITYDARTEFYKVVGQEGAVGPSSRVRVIIRPKPKTSQEQNTKQ